MSEGLKFIQVREGIYLRRDLIVSVLVEDEQGKKRVVFDTINNKRHLSDLMSEDRLHNFLDFVLEV